MTWKLNDNSDNLVPCSEFPTTFSSQQPSNDYCIGSIGVYGKDISICDQAGTARAECYGFLADTDNSISLDICDRLDTGATFCYMHVAYRLNNITICDKAGENKDNCLSLAKSRNTYD